jgi:hypothetical protein
MKYRIIFRYFRSLFNSKRSYSKSETLYLVDYLASAGYDLYEANGSREKTALKQSFVYYMANSGMNSMQLESLFLSIGLPQKGFSDRNIRHMIQTIGQTASDIALYRSHQAWFNSILFTK